MVISKKGSDNLSLGLLHFLFSNLQIILIQLITIDILIFFAPTLRKQNEFAFPKYFWITVIILGYIILH